MQAEATSALLESPTEDATTSNMLTEFTQPGLLRLPVELQKETVEYFGVFELVWFRSRH